MRWLVVLVLAGCGSKDDGPPCTAVVDHMLEVTKAMPGHDGMQMGDRKQMIGICEQRNYTADEKRCIVSAKDLAAIAACKPAGRTGN